MNFNKIKSSLKKHEGKRNLPYQDSLGVWTVGYGHNMNVPLSDRAIELILEDDIHEAVYQLDNAWPEWRDYPEAIQDIVVELCFNMGIGSLVQFENMRNAMNNGDWEEASSQLLDSRYADQVGQRAETLAERMLEVG